jgi:hypothetical protein
MDIGILANALLLALVVGLGGRLISRRVEHRVDRMRTDLTQIALWVSPRPRPQTG